MLVYPFYISGHESWECFRFLTLPISFNPRIKALFFFSQGPAGDVGLPGEAGIQGAMVNIHFNDFHHNHNWGFWIDARIFLVFLLFFRLCAREMR
jgi:hypothetical protein